MDTNDRKFFDTNTDSFIANPGMIFSEGNIDSQGTHAVQAERDEASFGEKQALATAYNDVTKQLLEFEALRNNPELTPEMLREIEGAIAGITGALNQISGAMSNPTTANIAAAMGQVNLAIGNAHAIGINASTSSTALQRSDLAMSHHMALSAEQSAYQSAAASMNVGGFGDLNEQSQIHFTPAIQNVLGTMPGGEVNFALGGFINDSPKWNAKKEETREESENLLDKSIEIAKQRGDTKALELFNAQKRLNERTGTFDTCTTEHLEAYNDPNGNHKQAVEGFEQTYNAKMARFDSVAQSSLAAMDNLHPEAKDEFLDMIRKKHNMQPGEEVPSWRLQMEAKAFNEVREKDPQKYADLTNQAVEDLKNGKSLSDLPEASREAYLMSAYAIPSAAASESYNAHQFLKDLTPEERKELASDLSKAIKDDPSKIKPILEKYAAEGKEVSPELVKYVERLKDDVSPEALDGFLKHFVEENDPLAAYNYDKGYDEFFEYAKKNNIDLTSYDYSQVDKTIANTSYISHSAGNYDWGSVTTAEDINAAIESGDATIGTAELSPDLAKALTLTPDSNPQPSQNNTAIASDSSVTNFSTLVDPQDFQKFEHSAASGDQSSPATTGMDPNLLAQQQAARVGA